MKKILFLLLATLPLVFGSCSPEDETPKGADWAMSCKFKLEMFDWYKPRFSSDNGYAGLSYAGIIDMGKNGYSEGDITVRHIGTGGLEGLYICDKDGKVIKKNGNHIKPDYERKLSQPRGGNTYKPELDVFTVYQKQNKLSRSGKFMIVVYTMSTIFYTYVDIKESDYLIDKEYTLVQKDSDEDKIPDTPIRF